jgi:hypothetical protein
MSSVKFPPEMIIQLEKSILEGQSAQKFSQCCYPWVNDRILKAIEEKAMIILRTSKTDEERIEAKQLSLVAVELRRIVDGLINQGKGAQEQLTEISTQEGENAT